MKRSTVLLLLGCIFMSFGYTHRTQDGDVSKIYLIGTTLIRTTPGKDIRFYNIASPAAVSELGKIDMRENSDVAVSGTIMYADQGYDLVVFDISDPAAVKRLDTIRKVFNSPASYVPRWDWEEGEGDWVEDDMGGMSGCGGAGCGEEVAYDSAPMAGGENGGQGGSLARFMIVGNYLYCIDQSELSVFDITDPARPAYRNRVGIDWMIETIFHANGHLFIGGRQGVYIYSIADPDNPQYVSDFQHANRCDPVVVEGNRAYVTLRGGSACGGFSNQMDILDISDIRKPRLIKTVPMDGPYGLAVRDGIAMVCDGESGLKSFDVSDPNNVRQCGTLGGLTPYDVIWYGNLAIVTAENGFFLYDAADPCNLKTFGKLF